jgi:hypothetical protein
VVQQVTPVLRGFVNEVFGSKALPAPVLTALPNNTKVVFASESCHQLLRVLQVVRSALLACDNQDLS